MNSYIVQTPTALILAALITHVGWATFGMEASMLWMTVSALVMTAVLAPRSIIELGVIGLVTLFAELNSAIAPDIMLAVLAAIILFPKDLLPFSLGARPSQAG